MCLCRRRQIHQALLPDGQRRLLCALHGPDGGGAEEAGGRHRSSQAGGPPGAGSEDEHSQYGPLQRRPEGGREPDCGFFVLITKLQCGKTSRMT